MEYRVGILVICRDSMTIEADSEEDAINQMDKMYDDGDIDVKEIDEVHTYIIE